MVPVCLSTVAARRARNAVLGAGALIALAGCRKAAPPAASTGTVTGLAGQVAEVVRTKYTAPDVEAAGAWAWMTPDSIWYVMVDAQSAVQGFVQGRAELWMANTQVAELFGRSEVLPSAAELGAYDFDDLTGDGVPDFFGYVADSSGTSFPVFFAGARPGMTEEIAIAGAGWRFSTDEEHQPVTAGSPRPCALQLWAESPTPDNQPEGWRWMAILRDGRLAAPTATAPSCNAAPGAGLQADSARP